MLYSGSWAALCRKNCEGKSINMPPRPRCMKICTRLLLAFSLRLGICSNRTNTAEERTLTQRPHNSFGFNSNRLHQFYFVSDVKKTTRSWPHGEAVPFFCDWGWRLDDARLQHREQSESRVRRIRLPLTFRSSPQGRENGFGHQRRIERPQWVCR